MIGKIFSEEFGVSAKYLSDNGIFNPTLDVDTPLFIDPLLLSHSQHAEFNDCAQEALVARFSEIHRVLAASTVEDDKCWQAAYKKFDFGEDSGMSGTCLGYSKSGSSGRGMGKVKRKKSLRWAKEVIDLGVDDPEMFSVLPLFEGGIGADLISDMVFSIISGCVFDFNERIIQKIKTETGVDLPLSEYKLKGRDLMLPMNPHSDQNHPVILVSADVLRDLPTAEDANALAKAINENAELRDDFNRKIGEIWRMNQEERTKAIKERAMKNAAAFSKFLDALKFVDKNPYDWKRDPSGLTAWVGAATQLLEGEDLNLPSKKETTLDDINKVVLHIIELFSKFVEKNRAYRLFYDDMGNARHERFAQLVFQVVALTVCSANNLGLSPESDQGAGPVDFKISSGSEKVLVEIKLSTNTSLVSGYTKQVDAYVEAESAAIAHYVVIDVGKIGEKYERLQEVRNQRPDFAETRYLHLIDGTPKVSASKRK